ncbi:MAG: L-threonylcarbamoyladenylate synthase [Oscillospiraceae bacterium]|nr:L-threonylcarbamoyladenylate synthase [Oscillospiraceae bacterium]
METQYLEVSDENFEEATALAAKLLKSGKIIGLPTETVYGLAASAYDEAAVREIFRVKGRPQDNPIIVHICDMIMLREIVQDIPPCAAELARAFWPGPFTMIFKKSEKINDTVTCGMDTVAVRMPSNPVAAKVIEKAGVPVAAPSANLSGKPSPTTGRHVLDDLHGKIPLILDAGPCQFGVESTVISLVGDTPTILRPGCVTPEEIRSILPDAVVSDAVLHEVKPNEKVLSPGMKYKHYAPRADVVIVKGTLEQFAKYAQENASGNTYAMCFNGEGEQISVPSVSYGKSDDPSEQAHKLFSVLRMLDTAGATTVFARCPSEDGVALAVFNRLIRAAGFKVVEL